MLTNIGIGTNLNSRTLHLVIDGEPTFDSGTHTFITTDQGNSISASSVDGRNRIYYTYNNSSYTLYDTNSGGVVADSFFTAENFGTVISADTSVSAYEYIKRDTHEKLYVYDEDLSRHQYDPEYVPNSTLNLYRMIAAGNLTSVNKVVQFFIPLSKPVSSEVHSVIWYAYHVMIRHSDGGYIINNDSLSSYGTVATEFTENGIYVALTLNTASTFTNNCPVTVYFGEGDRLIFSSNS